MRRSLAVSLLYCLALAACAVNSPQLQPDSHELTVQQALAQLDALPVPAGADPVQFEDLRAALRTQLEHTDISKWTSVAPTDAPNKVGDLYLIKVDDTTATAHWTYKNVGDYDQNSEVNIADLSGLGSNLGKTSTSPDWGKARVADGDGNGAITISDLTPLGSHLLNTVDGYSLQLTATPADVGSWNEIAFVPLSAATLGADGPRTFSVDIPATANQSFRVVPVNGGDYGVSSVVYAYDGVGGPPPVDQAEYDAVLAAIKDKFDNGLTGATSDEQDQELTDFIQAQPHIVQAEFRPGVIWGNFSDGRTVVVFKERQPDEADLQMYQPASAMPPAPFGPLPARQASTIPTDKSALIFSSFTLDEPYYQVPEVPGMLDAQDYTVTAGIPTTIDNLKALGTTFVPLDVLYFDGHGGLVDDENGVSRFAITTTEAQTDELDETYHADLQDGSLVTGLVKLKNGGSEWRYGFTGKFVDKYNWSFNPCGMVFLDICNGGQPSDLQTKLFAAGAKYVVGWNDVVRSSRAKRGVKQFFATMLGSNANLDYVSGGPPQRAFGTNATLSALHNKGIAAAPAPSPLMYPAGLTAELVENKNNFFDESGVLVPSIRSAVVQTGDVDGDHLIITGCFDESAGKTTVYLNGVEQDSARLVRQEKLSTDECVIEYRISLVDALAGDIVVKQNGHSSNPYALTEWTGNLHYSSDYHHDDWNGHFSYSVLLHVHFRGCIQKYRNTPGSAVDWWSEVQPGATNGSLEFCVDSDAECTDTGNQLTQDFTWTDLQSVQHQNTVTYTRAIDETVGYYNNPPSGAFMTGSRTIDLRGGIIHMDPYASFECSYIKTNTDPPQNGEDQAPTVELPSFPAKLIASGIQAATDWTGDYATNGGENFDLPSGARNTIQIDNGKEHTQLNWWWDGFSVTGKPNPDAPR